MMTRAYRVAAISAALMTGGIATTAQAQDCRAITDPAARLACYDKREATGTYASPEAAERAAPEPYRRPATGPSAAPAPAAAAPVTAPINPDREFTSRIVAVNRMDNGFYALHLANGSEWHMTAIGAPPKVGEAVHHRRTLVGTHYFDIKSRKGPLTVRPTD
jgi:hypothetical protein